MLKAKVYDKGNYSAEVLISLTSHKFVKHNCFLFLLDLNNLISQKLRHFLFLLLEEKKIKVFICQENNCEQFLYGTKFDLCIVPSHNVPAL